MENNLSSKLVINTVWKNSHGCLIRITGIKICSDISWQSHDVTVSSILGRCVSGMYYRVFPSKGVYKMAVRGIKIIDTKLKLFELQAGFTPVMWPEEVCQTAELLGGSYEV